MSRKNRIGCWAGVLLIFCMGVVVTPVNAQLLCQPGTFSPTGLQPCTDCAPGTFQPDTGENSCIPCQPGRFSPNPGAEVCIPCAPGNFASNPGQQFCTPCQQGRFAASPGSVSCQLCAPGSFAANTGQVSCDLCAAGTAQSAAGSSECIDCVPGFIAAVPGLATCSACPAGRFQDMPGSMVCFDCPEDTFQDQPGQVECIECPICSTSLVGSAACTLDECIDVDTDGFGEFGCPSCPGGTTPDCDDSEPTIFPGAVEVCDDLIDNDCDLDTDCADSSCAPEIECGGPDGDGDGVADVHDVCGNTPAGLAVDAEGRPLGDIDKDCDTDLVDFQLFASGFSGPL